MPKIKLKSELPDIGNKLHVHDFGKQLIETGDLDPVYILCDRFDWDSEEQFNSWLIAYWCFYHVGTACWCSEATSEQKFWNRLKKAAGSKKYHRSPERRHFRANNALDSVKFLKSKGLLELFKPFYFPEQFLGTSSPTAKQLIDYVKTWEGFGPWIAFKVADMMQALNILHVEFDHDVVCVYKEPLKGAEQVSFHYYPHLALTGKKQCWGMAYAHLITQLGKELAPPQYARKIDIPEVETILCKWKSHMNNKYKVGEDIHSIGKALDKYPDCETAQEMKEVFLNAPQFQSTIKRFENAKG